MFYLITFLKGKSVNLLHYFRFFYFISIMYDILNMYVYELVEEHRVNIFGRFFYAQNDFHPCANFIYYLLIYALYLYILYNEIHIIYLLIYFVYKKVYLSI